MGRVLLPTGVLFVLVFVAVDGARLGNYPVLGFFGVFLIIAGVLYLSSRDESDRTEEEATRDADR